MLLIEVLLGLSIVKINQKQPIDHHRSIFENTNGNQNLKIPHKITHEKSHKPGSIK